MLDEPTPTERDRLKELLRNREFEQLIELVQAMGWRRVRLHMCTANLSGRSFAHADLRAIRWDGCAFFRSDLRFTNFAGANLRNCNLIRADLRGAVLRQADLRGSVLSEADLRGTDLHGAKIRNVSFSNARYDEQTRWPERFAWYGSGAQGPPPEDVNQYFRRLDLMGGRLFRIALPGVQRPRLKARRLLCVNVDLTGAMLRGADLRRARLISVRLDGADLRDTMFDNAFFRLSTIEGAQLDGATFSGIRWGSAIKPPDQFQTS